MHKNNTVEIYVSVLLCKGAYMSKIIGKSLPNIPWQEKPQGYKMPVWRYTENPIIGRNDLQVYSAVTADRSVWIFLLEEVKMVSIGILRTYQSGLKAQMKKS